MTAQYLDPDMPWSTYRSSPTVKVLGVTCRHMDCSYYSGAVAQLDVHAIFDADSVTVVVQRGDRCLVFARGKTLSEAESELEAELRTNAPFYTEATEVLFGGAR